MAQQGYYSSTSTVGGIQDRSLVKPNGDGVVQITPTVPAAVFQTNDNSGTGAHYTKTSSTVLVLTFASPPGFTTSSLAGVFWGNGEYCLDCTITTITGNVVTITAPGSIPAGMSDFTDVTPGTTVITVAIATLATSDLPNNPDLTAYTLPEGDLQQLLVTAAGGTGAFEIFVGSDMEFHWNYSAQGDFYNWLVGEAAPWTGTADKFRFYNSTLTAQVMSIGAILL